MRAKPRNRPNGSRAGKAKARLDLDQLIRRVPPVFETLFIDEPKLVFGDGNVCVDPKTGIAEHGPISTGRTKSVVSVGAIGSGEGIDAFAKYLEKVRGPVLAGLNSRQKPFDPLVFPRFPGTTARLGFRTDFVTSTGLQRCISERDFQKAVESPNPSTRLREVVTLVCRELQALADIEPNPDVVAIVLPSCVEDACATVGAQFRHMKIRLTPGQRLLGKWDKERLRSGQDFLHLTFDDSAQDGQVGYWNIHHALKAHAMATRLTTQVVWQSTIAGDRATQDPASMAWNLVTALYYKSGNIPWQLQQVPRGTCFVGVSFYRVGPHADSQMQTSLAQVFSGTGEGLVLKGARAVVDKRRDRQPHLDKDGAETLLRQALQAYRDSHFQEEPNRVVVHKTSRYWPEELAGFRKALGSICRYDFLTLDRQGHQFMRLGKHPPLRGTVVTLAPRRHVLFTQGYIPYLGIYPGQRIPNPLEIVEHHGDSQTAVVCEEILALTKVNWNSCFFGSSAPITIRFARSVGKILAELPDCDRPETKYKFYM